MREIPGEAISRQSIEDRALEPCIDDAAERGLGEEAEQEAGGQQNRQGDPVGHVRPEHDLYRNQVGDGLDRIGQNTQSLGHDEPYDHQRE